VLGREVARGHYQDVAIAHARDEPVGRGRSSEVHGDEIGVENPLEIAPEAPDDRGDLSRRRASRD
jgi:hypothetical protein